MALSVLKLCPHGGSVVLCAHESAILRHFLPPFWFEKNGKEIWLPCILFNWKSQAHSVLLLSWCSLWNQTVASTYYIHCEYCLTLNCHLPVTYHQARQITSNSMIYPIRQILSEIKSHQMTVLTFYPVGASIFPMLVELLATLYLKIFFFSI